MTIELSKRLLWAIAMTYLFIGVGYGGAFSEVFGPMRVGWLAIGISTVAATATGALFVRETGRPMFIARQLGWGA